MISKWKYLSIYFVADLLLVHILLCLSIRWNFVYMCIFTSRYTQAHQPVTSFTCSAGALTALPQGWSVPTEGQLRLSTKAGCPGTGQQGELSCTPQCPRQFLSTYTLPLSFRNTHDKQLTSNTKSFLSTKVKEELFTSWKTPPSTTAVVKSHNAAFFCKRVWQFTIWRHRTFQGRQEAEVKEKESNPNKACSSNIHPPNSARHTGALFSHTVTARAQGAAVNKESFCAILNNLKCLS